VALAVGGGIDGDGPEAQPSRAGAPPDTRAFAPRAVDPANLPSEPVPKGRYRTARPHRTVLLRARPGGPGLARVGARTEFGSPTVLSVVRRRGGWIAVLAPELRNRRLGWMRVEEARPGRVGYSLRADLSRGLLVVRRDGRTLRRMTVATGRAGNPTPTGRFAVTDRLRVRDRGSPYGCCVLALTGHQTKLLPGWRGGDRLAVHSTADSNGSPGGARSLGCLRADRRQARWLIETIPLGTPVFINS